LKNSQTVYLYAKSSTAPAYAVSCRICVFFPI
jgi:hypothetical protein